jgi:hypothetical protein
MSVDPINKRIYVVVPLDGAAAPTHILVGDFRDGLDPADIKWCPWTISPAPNTILVYNDFSAGDPVLVTRLASLGQLATINVGTWGGDDAGVTPLRIAEMPPFRYLSTGGISIYNNLNIRVYGRDRIYMFAYSMDKKKFFDLKGLSLNDETPGREYSLPMNLVSEQCRFLMKSNIGYFACNSVLIEGKPLWKGRQRGNG